MLKRRFSRTLYVVGITAFIAALIFILARRPEPEGPLKIDTEALKAELVAGQAYSGKITVSGKGADTLEIECPDADEFGIAFDAGTNTVSWTPSKPIPDGVGVEFVAKNAKGDVVATATWQVKVVPQEEEDDDDDQKEPPAISVEALQAGLTVGEAYAGTLTVTGEGADALKIECANGRELGIELDSTTRTVSWTPSKAAPEGIGVEFAAKDEKGEVVTKVTWQVKVLPRDGEADDDDDAPEERPAISVEALQAELKVGQAYSGKLTVTGPGADALKIECVNAKELGVTFDPGTKAVSWTPAKGGRHTVRFVARNQEGTPVADAVWSVHVQPKPDEPKLAALPKLPNEVSCQLPGKKKIYGSAKVIPTGPVPMDQIERSIRGALQHGGVTYRLELSDEPAIALLELKALLDVGASFTDSPDRPFVAQTNESGKKAVAAASEGKQCLVLPFQVWWMVLRTASFQKTVTKGTVKWRVRHYKPALGAFAVDITEEDFLDE